MHTKIMIIGSPGSGKSTFAKKITRQNRFAIVLLRYDKT